MSYEVMVLMLLVVVSIAALATTAMPILYSFSHWRSTKLGPLFMMQAISFAAAIDMTILFYFWHPSIVVQFWVQFFVFSSIAVSTSLLVWFAWRLNHPKKGRKKHMMLTNRTYNFMKYFVQIALPAIATFYFLMGQIWHLPMVEEVMATITGVATLLGSLLGLSTKAYNNPNNPMGKYDGEILVTKTEDRTLMSLELNKDPGRLEEQKDASFKVTVPPPN